jgi:hypothetical protein
MGELGVTEAVETPDLRRPPRDLRSFWRWTLALVAPIAFLALATSIWLLPYEVGADLPAQLLGIAKHPDRMHAALWLSTVFAVVAVPGVIAVAWSTRRRAPWLSLIGGIIAIVAFAEAGTGAGTDLLAIIGVTEGIAMAQLQAVGDAVTAHPAGQVGLFVFLIGQCVGLILLGTAMYRSRVAPRWMGVALAVSGPAHLLLPGGNVGVGVGWLLTAVGCAGASIALVRTANDSFDLGPVTS